MDGLICQENILEECYILLNTIYIMTFSGIYNWTLSSFYLKFTISKYKCGGGNENVGVIKGIHLFWTGIIKR